MTEGREPAERRAAISYSYDGPSMAEAAAALEAKKREHRGMGGAERVARQHDSNKLTVRERLDLLFDEATFVEHGAAGASPVAVPGDAGEVHTGRRRRDRRSARSMAARSR